LTLPASKTAAIRSYSRFQPKWREIFGRHLAAMAGMLSGATS